MTLLFIGGAEIFIIALIVVMLFGADKIPELARGLGKGMRQLRDATDDLKREINDSSGSVVSDIKKEVDDVKKGIDKVTEPLGKKVKNKFEDHIPDFNPLKDTVEDIKDLKDTVSKVSGSIKRKR